MKKLIFLFVLCGIMLIGIGSAEFTFQYDTYPTTTKNTTLWVFPDNGCGFSTSQIVNFSIRGIYSYSGCGGNQISYIFSQQVFDYNNFINFPTSYLKIEYNASSSAVHLLTDFSIYGNQMESFHSSSTFSEWKINYSTVEGLLNSYRNNIFNKTFAPSGSTFFIATMQYSDFNPGVTGRIEFQNVTYTIQNLQKTELTEEYDCLECVPLTHNLTVNITTPNLTAFSFTAQQPTIQNTTLMIWRVSDSNLVYNETTVLSGISNTTVFSNISLPLGFYSFNSLSCTQQDCSFADTNLTFSNGLVENLITYNSTTYETASETFTLNTTLASLITSSSATFYYNGVNKGASTKTVVGDNTIFTNTIDIPIGSGSKDFYWVLNLNNINLNTTINSQNVNPIILSLCNSTVNVPFFNFSIKEEGTFDTLNASLETIWTYHLGSGSVNKNLLFSDLNDNRSNFGFCFTPPDKEVIITGLTNYYSAGYDARTYYFSNTIKNNASGNIDLFLLSTAASDIVVFTVVDEFLLPVANVNIRILRWDLVTDTFSLVNEIVTGATGQASANLRLNDAWYKFLVSVGGETLLETDAERLFSTTKTLQIALLPDESIYDKFREVDFSLTFDNSTNIITFTWNDQNSEIDGACLLITQLTPTGTKIISDVCVNSVSGSIPYEFISNNTFTATAKVFKNTPFGKLQFILSTLTLEIGTPERFLQFEKSTHVISLVFIGTMAMLGVAIGNIPVGLILIVFSFVTLNLLGFVNFSQSFIVTVICIILLIFISLQRRYG